MSVEQRDDTPYAQRPPSRDLAELRLRAEDCGRRKDDAALLGLADDLRSDDEMWAHLWAPALAVAAARSGRADGLAFLEAALDGGFCQPELFEGEIERLFADQPGWDAVARRLAANVPPPVLALIDFPDPAPSLPLMLDKLPEERADLLRAQLPVPLSSAWETAKELLAWVRRRWDHANDHVEDPDAVDVLDRVDAGERFACVEYSIVLSQALNAVEIPARRVQLVAANSHVGVGRGHVVSEAWIDDLARWVLLDGQNGAFWADQNGEPLGVLELQRAFAEGERPAAMVSVVPEVEPPSAEAWSQYFADAMTTGYRWTSRPTEPCSLVFQTTRVMRTGRLVHDPGAVYPDLSVPAVGIGGDIEAPLVTLATAHPCATGFVVTEGEDAFEVPIDDAKWELREESGTHDAAIAVRTRYGACRPVPLRYRREG